MVAAKFAGLMAVKNVGQAVQMLRDQDRDSRHVPAGFQRPLHIESGGELFEAVGERGQIEAFQSPFHAHEKQTLGAILMLIGVGDVGAVLVQHAGDLGHESFAIGAMDEENGGVFLIHGRKW